MQMQTILPAQLRNETVNAHARNIYIADVTQSQYGVEIN